MTTYIPSLTLPARVFAQPALAMLLPVGAGLGIGYFITPREDVQPEYIALKQPPLRPPPWVFGPVWTVLYTMMGYASHRAWSTGMSSLYPQTRELTRQSATLYTIQLGLNFMFMPLFFRFQRPIEGTIDILALTGTTAYLTYIYSGIDEVAAWTMVPYLGWLTFASYLSVGIGYLNNWNFTDKQAHYPPKSKPAPTKYVNEAPPDKKAL